MKINVSAPGKLILLGEHAVVYQRPCLVSAVSQRLTLKLEKIKERNFEIDRKDKKGFPVPLTDWYQGPLKKFVQNILLSKRAKNRGIYKFDGIKKILKTEQKFGRQIWGLLCLELWFRTFIDSKNQQ